jgi:hypothetical protein
MFKSLFPLQFEVKSPRNHGGFLFFGKWRRPFANREEPSVTPREIPWPIDWAILAPFPSSSGWPRTRKPPTLHGTRSTPPLVDGELVAYREDLKLAGSSRSEASAERREEDCHYEVRRLPHIGGTHRESLAEVAFPETLLNTVASPFSGRTHSTAAVPMVRLVGVLRPCCRGTSRRCYRQHA